METLKVKPFEPEIEALCSCVDSMRAIGWHKPVAFVWPASHLASQLTVNDFWYLRARTQPKRFERMQTIAKVELWLHHPTYPDQLVKFQLKFSAIVCIKPFSMRKTFTAATSIRFMCFCTNCNSTMVSSRFRLVRMCTVSCGCMEVWWAWSW